MHIFSRIVLASAKLNKHQIRFYCNLENKTNHPGIFHLLAPRQALPIIPTESRLKIYFRTDNPILSFVSILFSALPTTVLRYPVCKFFVGQVLCFCFCCKPTTMCSIRNCSSDNDGLSYSSPHRLQCVQQRNKKLAFIDERENFFTHQISFLS